MVLKHEITANDSEKTVKSIIDSVFNLSSRMLSRLKKSGGIRLDGVTVTVRHVVHEGNVLTLEIFDRVSDNIVPCDIPVDVLYEDEYIIAVNKPSGMPTHPSLNHRTDTLANAIMYRYKDNPFSFHPITRLDCDTTGVVLIAKDSLSCQRLSEAMKNGYINKEYLAVCCGVPEIKEGTIDAKIARLQGSVIKRQISDDGKEALTVYNVQEISHSRKFSLIHLIPKTGRTHQLRLHLSHIGFPIYADFLYGKEVIGQRTCLHCSSLSFPHPITNQNINISAPLPSDMKAIMEQ